LKTVIYYQKILVIHRKFGVVHKIFNLST